MKLLENYDLSFFQQRTRLGARNRQGTAGALLLPYTQPMLTKRKQKRPCFRRMATALGGYEAPKTDGPFFKNLSSLHMATAAFKETLACMAPAVVFVVNALRAAVRTRKLHLWRLYFDWLYIPPTKAADNCLRLYHLRAEWTLTFCGCRWCLFWLGGFFLLHGGHKTNGQQGEDAKNAAYEKPCKTASPLAAGYHSGKNRTE